MISAELVKILDDFTPYAKSIMEHQLSRQERYVVAAMAYDSAHSAEDIFKASHRITKHSRSHLSVILSRLCVKGVLKKVSRANYEFKEALLSDWLNMRHKRRLK